MCFLVFLGLVKGRNQHPLNISRQNHELNHSQECQSEIFLHVSFTRVLIPDCPKTWKQLFQLLLFLLVFLQNSANVIRASSQIIVLIYFQMAFFPVSFDILLSSSELQNMDYFKSSQ